jgi:hypothetical protein
MLPDVVSWVGLIISGSISKEYNKIENKLSKKGKE